MASALESMVYLSQRLQAVAIPSRNKTMVDLSTVSTWVIPGTCAKLRKEGKVALAPINTGKPDFSTTAQASKVLELWGSAIFDLGFPCSDSLTGSPVIQVAPELYSPIALISYQNQLLKCGVEKFMSIINDAGVHDSQGERGRHHSACLLERDQGLFEKIFSEDAIISMLKEVVSQTLALLSKYNPHLKRGVEEVMSIINDAGFHENLNVRGAGGCLDSQGERGRHHSAWLLEKIFSKDAIISMLKEVVSQSLASFSKHNPHLKHGIEEVMSIINDAGVHENLLIRRTGGCLDLHGERGRHHSAFLLEGDRGLFEKNFSEDAIIFTLKGVVSQSLAFFSKYYLHLKRGVEEVMSIINDAGFHGQHPSRAYDAFISYKKDDTLHPVSHLKSALDRRKIKTFVDFTLDGGVEFWLAIDEAIKRSKIAIVVVSQNFHSSPWCLNELVKILECRKKWGLIVLPIFWRVNARELREQPRHFVENIGQGEKGFKQDNPHQVQKWRDALRTLGMIKGWSYSTSLDKTEAEVIEYLVDKISAKVNCSVVSVPSHPAGFNLISRIRLRLSKIISTF